MPSFAALPKYQTLQESHEGWIGKIPGHWRIEKLKHLFYEKKHTKNMSLNCGSISFGEVVTKDDSAIPASTKSSYQEVRSGDFLINPLNLNYDLISLRIALSEIDVVVSAGYIVIREKVELNKRYIKYLLHRYDVAYMKLLGSGVRQTISFNHIANSLLPFPPSHEQDLIASFLDKKTTQIDEAIAIKEQQIALLKERKQIIIQKAVTQGLDPDVPMKDSGVDWIGAIPAHWGISRLKFYSKIQSGITLGKNYPPENLVEVPYLRVANVQFGYFKLDEVATIRIPRGEVGRYLLEDKDILVTEGGDIDKLGRGTIWKSAISPCIHQNHIFAIRIDFDKFSHEFVSNYLGCDSSRKHFIATATKTTNLASTNRTHLGNLYIPVPSLSEQADINTYIEHQSESVDNAINIQLSQIEKLKEYKTTLINSAVTGKIKITPDLV